MKNICLRTLPAALLLCLAALLLSSQAQAQTSDNTIKACYNTTNGQMRQVSGPSDCKNGETYILWNVQGPKGDKGDTGAQGPVGPQGPQGPAGPQGPKGDTGATGPQGPAGPQGPQGEKGEKGDTGATGATGAQGPQGQVGPQGPAGSQGPQGPQGEKGDTGATGPQGPAGPQGATGAQGPQGEQGPQGATGPQGPQGATGATGPQGPQGPQGQTGATGPQGPQGDPGQSVTGTPVPPGANCPNGGVMYTSASGNHFVCNGAPGAQGPQGPVGPQGPQGPTVATFPIGRAPEGNFAAITFNDDTSSFVCNGQYLGQATIDPSWFGGSIDYRVVVFAARTAGVIGQNLYFDFCAGSSLGDGGGSNLFTNVVFNNPQMADSGWQTYAGGAPFRINLRARKNSPAAGSFGHAYILVRPHQ